MNNDDHDQFSFPVPSELTHNQFETSQEEKKAIHRLQSVNVAQREAANEKEIQALIKNVEQVSIDAIREFLGQLREGQDVRDLRTNEAIRSNAAK